MDQSILLWPEELHDIIFLFQFFGCEAKTDSKINSNQVNYLQSEAHAKKAPPSSQAVQVGNMIYLSGVIGR